jgi:hypothetical protein
MDESSYFGVTISMHHLGGYRDLFWCIDIKTTHNSVYDFSTELTYIWMRLLYASVGHVTPYPIDII